MDATVALMEDTLKDQVSEQTYIEVYRLFHAWQNALEWRDFKLSNLYDMIQLSARGMGQERAAPGAPRPPRRFQDRSGRVDETSEATEESGGAAAPDFAAERRRYELRRRGRPPASTLVTTSVSTEGRAGRLEEITRGRSLEELSPRERDQYFIELRRRVRPRSA